jgi:hypothetical protein
MRPIKNVVKRKYQKKKSCAWISIICEPHPKQVKTFQIVKNTKREAYLETHVIR